MKSEKVVGIRSRGFDKPVSYARNVMAMIVMYLSIASVVLSVVLMLWALYQLVRLAWEFFQ